MSRVGKEPIAVPEGVKITIHADNIEFAGPKVSLTSPLFPGINAELKDNQLIITRDNDAGKLVKTTRKRNGLYGRPEYIWRLPEAAKQMELL